MIKADRSRRPRLHQRRPFVTQKSPVFQLLRPRSLSNWRRHREVAGLSVTTGKGSPCKGASVGVKGGIQDGSLKWWVLDRSWLSHLTRPVS